MQACRDHYLERQRKRAPAVGTCHHGANLGPPMYAPNLCSLSATHKHDELHER